jgi:hypothetical protein
MKRWLGWQNRSRCPLPLARRVLNVACVSKLVPYVAHGQRCQTASLGIP